MSELDRRSFLKIAGLSAGAAATVACKEPVERIVPYLNQPEEIIPGRATYYASLCRECPQGCSIQVKTREGRPIKVDGNPLDPLQRGKLCARGQLSLARTYDSHRFAGPQKRGSSGSFEPIAWDAALGEVAQKLQAAAGSGRIAFLGGLETGTFGTLIDQFLAQLGSSRRTVFELYAYEALRQANQQLFGLPSVPQFKFGEADVVVAFGTDFSETWMDTVQNSIGYSDSRRGGKGFSAFIGPRLSLSAANCDQWLAPQPGSEILVALGLAREVAAQGRGPDLGPLRELLEPYTLERVASETALAPEALRALAVRVTGARSLLALPPGVEIQGPNATAFAIAVQVLNYAAGSLGRTVVFGPDHNLRDVARFQDLLTLRDQLASGSIDVLIVHGANPAYSIPGFAAALAKTTVVSLSSANDETTALASWVLPDHTAYESWGDAQPQLGVRRLQQPTVNPLFDTRAAGDVLIDLAQRAGKPLEGGDFRTRLTAAWTDWNGALARGGDVALPPATSVALAPSAASVRFESFAPSGEGELVLAAYPSIYLYDGRSARIAHLQELPDPVTKLVWGSYAELHSETAAELGVELGSVVRVTSERGSIELPVFPHDGLRRGIVAIAVGQGHQPVNPNAPETPLDFKLRREQVGVNVLSILPERLDAASGGLAWFGTRVRVESLDRKVPIARTQASFDQEGRGIGQAITLADLLAAPEAGAAQGGHGESAVSAQAERSGEAGHGAEESHGAEGGHGEDHSTEVPYADALHLQTVPFDPAKDALDANYRWGMSIDIDSCSGCGACVAACVTENNIPSLGEMLVRQGREMHWIRIERYVDVKAQGELAVRHVPMLCQHCGAAPCESVCPVYATYHTPEGLNAMIPNRCIGTRYCGNNCPYKIRRFNYFPADFDYVDPENLALNPDVIVRSKGVMEKCTFCVQRINAAKDDARSAGRPKVLDGEIVPACAQTCPSNAIVFGNHKDPQSEVSRLHGDPRAYWVFQHLNTRPAVTYQKAIDRPVAPEA
jgi:anaerobic selenocysteine-containing dehydrogenase/Fe-S-cluster-containing dehydrogenase component